MKKSEQRRKLCCVDVLYQESSLAIFRGMSLAIYRHNVNLKLTDASVYKIYLLNLWHKDMPHVYLSWFWYLWNQQSLVPVTSFFQENINSQYKLLWPVQKFNQLAFYVQNSLYILMRDIIEINSTLHFVFWWSLLVENVECNCLPSPQTYTQIVECFR